jgi:beta-aspartyl-peptidase (threonine type)
MANPACHIHLKAARLTGFSSIVVGEQQLPSNPVLLVHGGAWSIPDELVQPHLSGVQRALSAGWEVLQRGGPALEAVEAATVVMEDDEAFDAGRGSFLNRDGRVQLDALLMDGATLRAGGVGCVERVRNPIRLARKVLESSPHVYLVAEGAERFAAEHGIRLCDNEDLIIDREVRRWEQAQAGQLVPASSHDTVGAVALDAHGNLAAATSTGGTLNKAPGRVGDSSLVGCGCYADNESGAISITGWGEPIMKLVLGKWAVDRIAEGVEPQAAASQAIARLQSRLNGHGGLILLDRQGRFGFAHNTRRMAWALRTADQQQSGIDRQA